ncbi:hypothetical protein AVEN_148426-1 [Araneus ventricosus]|uniref:Uncharacterized protein n=1 Tax=Araneus ventricosus TaxID=182803 RepID=A0A4Y2NYQ0_ARAVE|nr:hypothetical protein AVEN_148426-1 [Araneus ventricosus]
MNAIQKERNKKLKEVKNDLKAFKLQAEIRRNNEQQLEQELGSQTSLSDFHKPVTERLQQELSRKGSQTSLSDFHKPVTERLQQELSRKVHFKAIKDTVGNIPLAIDQPPPLQPPPLVVYNFDKELDVEYLEKNNFPRPSKLYNESQETLKEIVDRLNKIYIKMARQKGNIMSQFARMTKKDEEREDDLLDKADYLRDHIMALVDYRERLRDLQRKEIYVGKGVEDKLELLARFTDMLSMEVKVKNYVLMSLIYEPHC